MWIEDNINHRKSNSYSVSQSLHYRNWHRFWTWHVDIHTYFLFESIVWKSFWSCLEINFEHGMLANIQAPRRWRGASPADRWPRTTQTTCINHTYSVGCGEGICRVWGRRHVDIQIFLFPDHIQNYFQTMSKIIFGDIFFFRNIRCCQNIQIRPPARTPLQNFFRSALAGLAPHTL